MSTLGEFLRDEALNQEATPRLPRRGFFRRPRQPAPSDAPAPEPSAAFSPRHDQIRMLVQQLFFRHESSPLRNVAFAPAEASPQAARLCFDVAKALVEEGKYEVGLIDANFGSLPMERALQIPAPAGARTTWAVAPRVWLAPRDGWCQQDGQHPAADSNLERLRELTTEFDFSIVHCPPVSWLTARIGQVCDGLVLVLTANKTRRLVAAQVKDWLSKTPVPLLGTVLAERRFPVPSRLYRSL
jgi:hypothetical protein